MKDRPIVEGRSLENEYFYFTAPLTSVFRFYCCCYALAAKDLIAAVIFVIDLFFMKITVCLIFEFSIFKTKLVKESKGEINILLVILLRILRKMKNRYIWEQFIKGYTLKKLAISII